MTGRFVTLEGGEGCGKSTQAMALAEALRARGVNVLVTREPGGTPGAEAIRTLLLDKSNDWTMRAEALLFAAARADHVTKVIKPALHAGRWVICDRFIDSSRAYQTATGDLSDDLVMDMHKAGSGGFLPDITFLLRLPAELAETRATERDGGQVDRIGGRDSEYQSRVVDRFAQIAAEEPDRFRVIDASGAPETVTGRLMAELVGWLP